MRKILEFCNCPRGIVKKLSSPTFDDIKNSIIQGDINYLIQLIYEGAPLSGKGKNAIHYSILENNLEITKYLCQNYQELIQERNDQGDTPFMLALFQKQTEIISYLLPISNANSRDNNGNTPFIIASANGLVSVLERLIQNPNTNIQVKNFLGQTALHRACYYGQIQSVKLLIKRTNLKFCQTDKHGNNCLHLACMGVSITCIQFILKKVKNPQHLFQLNKQDKKPFNLLTEIINKILPTHKINIDHIQQKIYYNIKLPIND